MLEPDQDSTDEGSGAMLFQFLKCLLMILPQSTCYRILRDRLTSLARFRQSTSSISSPFHFSERKSNRVSNETEMYIARIREVRALHCDATWKTIRQGSLEIKQEFESSVDEGVDRLKWLGYGSKEEEQLAYERFRDDKYNVKNENRIEELKNDYLHLDSITERASSVKEYIIDNVHLTGAVDYETESDSDNRDEEQRWVNFWTNGDN
jgi:hypothetical protein